MDQQENDNRSTAFHQTFLFVALLAATIFLGILCQLSSKAAYSIFNRTWGFDNLMYFDRSVRLFGLLTLCLLLLPLSNTYLRQAIARAGDAVDGLSLTGLRRLIPFLLAFLFFFFFYRAQVKYHLLGDFDFRVNEIMQGKFVFTEYLSMLLLSFPANAALKMGIGSDTFFRAYSCFAGALFVWVSAQVAKETGKTTFEKTLLFCSVIFSAMMLVFCGYVEIYATPFLMLALYLWSAVRFLNGKTSFRSPAILLILAIGFHLFNLAAAPSLAVIYYWKNKEKFPAVRRLHNRQVAFSIAAMALVVLLIVFKSKNRYLMPLSSKSGDMTLLSFRHLWEFVNGQILCTGLNLFVCIVILLRSAAKKTALNGLQYFLMSLAGAYLTLVFICDLQRGSGDWDIMAFPATPVNLLCAVLCLQNTKRVGHYLLVFLCGFNLLNAVLWIAIQHGEKSVSKADSMYSSDPATYYRSRISGKLQLAFFFKGRNMYNTAEQFAFGACNQAKSGDYRGCLLYAECLRRRGQNEQAATTYEWLINEKHQVIYEAYLFLLEEYGEKNDAEKVQHYLNTFFDAYCANPGVFHQNANFDPAQTFQLFMALHEMEKNQAEESRLKKIRDTAAQLASQQRQNQ